MNTSCLLLNILCVYTLCAQPLEQKMYLELRNILTFYCIHNHLKELSYCTQMIH